jgi:hypothetical protein
MSVRETSHIDRPRHLVIVARDRPDRLRFWTDEFAGDATVEVLFDRRGGERREGSAGAPGAERRRSARRREPRWDEDLRFHPVFLVHRPLAATTGSLAPDHAATLLARDRVAGLRDRAERSLHEVCGLLGAFVPDLLGERAPLVARVAAIEQECQGLRQQLDDVEHELRRLRSENQRLREEGTALAQDARAAMADADRILEPVRAILRTLKAPPGTP